ncbi:hypothetical protein [Sphingomonas sp.]|uniref:hypothetical protein n=1 Tax=Sphingomonas sp. TaxID=28214 RepID=UPI000DB2EDC5|nr:hypothetical protein [Sphingomonas sp.]PZU06509.1 MAG: hypothetical protein DI605_18865 [Sphingomonas sp.]
MRKIIPVLALVVVAGCHRQVAVPTAQELINNRPLLTEWQVKCDTGEYSHLAATEKADLCSTTHDASMSVAAMKAGKQDSDFFGNMSKRK